jgi:hypothetical protein
MLKMKRTIALKMVVLAPLAVVLLTLFMASQAPYSTLRRTNGHVDAWAALARVNLQFWGLLMLPLYITLQTALIAGLDHADHQWKALLARPVPRWTFYIAKLIVVSVMTLTSAVLLVGFILLEGRVLHFFDAGLGFGTVVPAAKIAVQAAQMTALAFLGLTVQHWVGLRWRQFSIAIGFGIVAMVTGFAMLLTAGPYGAWPQYFPWSLPMLVLARNSQGLWGVLGVCGALSVATTAAGCVDFCWREIQ